MTVFTYSRARQNFASLLDTARADGEVLIKRRDGTVFTLKPLSLKGIKSPLDVPSIKCKVTTREIITAVRESRARIN